MTFFIPHTPSRVRGLFAAAGGPVRSVSGEPKGLPERTRRMARHGSVLAFGARNRTRTPMPRDLAHLSDEALVALVARSDEVAFGELYDRFGRVAYGLARRILRDDALAEDAVQEGFLAAWRSAARFVPERAKASTWLLTLVHRRAVDLVRREERRRAEAPDGRGQAGGPPGDGAGWARLQRARGP